MVEKDCFKKHKKYYESPIDIYLYIPINLGKDENFN